MNRWILRVPLLLLMAVAMLAVIRRDAVRWGHDGHLMVGLAAVDNLPDDMPQFFRDAREQLSWLNYDPDRWRNEGMVEANEAWQYDHFIDLEAVPDAALNEPNRFAYVLALQAAGIDRPENMGLLPFRVIELTQRLTQGFRQWRAETDPEVRLWLEQRVINDAGILGHYVADGANPHHSTIHYNGWASDAPNPAGYTMDRTFHRRFESDYVSAHVELNDITAQSIAPASVLADLRADVIAYVRRTNSFVRRLYELEKLEAFGEKTGSADHKSFTVGRMVAGVEKLSSIWYTAWVNSGTE